jgi:hypothetical protein
MIDFYARFERFPDIQYRSKQRLDLSERCGNYAPLLQRNKGGDCLVYFGGNTYTHSTSGRKSDFALKNSIGEHLSNVFFSGLESPNLAFGDVKCTSDALLLSLSENRTVLDVFVCIGKINVVHVLYSEFADGVFDERIATLKEQARRFGVVGLFSKAA